MGPKKDHGTSESSGGIDVKDLWVSSLRLSGSKLRRLQRLGS